MAQSQPRILVSEHKPYSITLCGHNSRSSHSCHTCRASIRPTLLRGAPLNLGPQAAPSPVAPISQSPASQPHWTQSPSSLLRFPASLDPIPWPPVSLTQSSDTSPIPAVLVGRSACRSSHLCHSVFLFPHPSPYPPPGPPSSCPHSPTPWNGCPLPCRCRCFSYARHQKSSGSEVKLSRGEG